MASFIPKPFMEAKFHDNPENRDIAGSPIIARIMNDVVDVLSQIDTHADTEAWAKWRDISSKKSSDIWKNIIKNASKNNMWNTYTEDKKLEIAENYISPFIATEEVLKEFIIEVKI